MYNLIVCVTENAWVAVDLNKRGMGKRISFDGNKTVAINSTESLMYFCDKILSHYNYEHFHEIDLNVKIFTFCGNSSLINDLVKQMDGVKNLNIIDAKSIIPICLLKRGIIKSGSLVEVKCLEEEQTVRIDENLMVSFTSDKADKTIELEPEDFSFMFQFDCNHLLPDDSEWKEKEKELLRRLEEKKQEIEDQKEKYSELKEKYDDLENQNQQMRVEINKNAAKEHQAMLETKRTLQRFSAKIMMETEIDRLFLGNSAYGIKFICKLQRKTGDIVKEGDVLVEITAISRMIMMGGNNYQTKRWINAEKSGRIAFLVKDDDDIKDKQPIVVISDVSDSPADMVKWYRKRR